MKWHETNFERQHHAQSHKKYVGNMYFLIPSCRGHSSPTLALSNLLGTGKVTINRI